MSSRPPERRQLTVMLCDLVGWTALSQRLDAEELAEILRAYRGRCTGLITRHGGTVAQYVGDAILAYFGYPRAHEDDAERAIRAALGIAAAERSAAPGGNSNVHIGIATGVVVVGDLAEDGGSRRANGALDLEGRSEISAVGSALNLAARLQGLAGPGEVVVSDQTRRLSRGIFEYRDLGRHALKGFDEPVHAWQVIGESKVRSRFHALRASTRTPLIDRQSELAELQRLWQSVLTGRGRALLISSDAGVGKSRLADEVARRFVGRRCLRLWYYCSPHLHASPLAPIVRQLTVAAGFADWDDDNAKLDKLVALVPGDTGDTAEIVPLLASLLSIRYEGPYPALSMSPQRRKQRLFQALIRLLERAAARTPVLLVVEDLHWVDPSSDELLGLVVDRLKTLPVLAIFTARPEFHPHWSDGAHFAQMRLSPLDRSDAMTMIESLCAAHGVPERTMEQIADRADGLPLFIEDLARDVLEVADLRQSDGAAPAVHRPTPFAIPATLTDSLMSRLDRLGPAKAVAQVGAVIGRDFSYELLARVSALREEELKEQLYRLVEAGLLVKRPATAILMYAFRHALMRDAAYSSLLRKGQMALHSRIACVLTDEFPETAESQPEILAHHFQAAGEIDDAVHHLINAAKLSARRSGFVEAISQLRSALGQLDAQPRTPARVRLALRAQLALGGVYAEYRGFSSAECGAAYTTALGLCHELGDAPEIFAVLSGVGSFEITRANFPRCRALAEESLARAARQQARPPFIMGHLLLGGTLFLTAEFATARWHLEEALRLYEEEREVRRGRQVLYVQDQKSTGLCYLGLTLALLGYPDSGLRAAERGLAHSRSLGGAHAVNFSLCYLAATHCFRRDPRAALRCATESLEMAREQGFATWIGVSQMIRGDSLVRSGDVEAGLAEIAAGMSAYRAIDAVTYQPFGLALLAEGLIVAGRLDEALDALAQALAMSERSGERFYLAELWRLKGEVLVRKGSASDGEHWLREAIRLAREQGARLLELRGAVSLCRLLEGPDRKRVLREVLEPACSAFDEGLDAADVQDARALLAARA
jgi:class 3 adenylate cyclase/predicted ATPase